MPHLRASLLLGLLLATLSCGSDYGSTTPVGTSNKTYDVFMIGDSFSPFSQTITPKDTIRWNFAPGSDGLGHNVRYSPRIAGSPADLPVQKTGTALSVFTTKGQFK